MRDIATQSIAHLTHLVWRFHTEPESFWGSLLAQKYLQSSSFRNCNQAQKIPPFGDECSSSDIIFLTTFLGPLAMGPRLMLCMITGFRVMLLGFLRALLVLPILFWSVTSLPGTSKTISVGRGMPYNNGGQLTLWTPYAPFL